MDENPLYSFDVLVKIFEFVECLTPAMFVCKSWHFATKYFTRTKGVCASGVLRYCAKVGNFDLMKWALDQGAPNEPNVIRCAIASGNLEMLEYVRIFLHTKWNRAYTTQIIRSGNIDMLEYIISEGIAYIRNKNFTEAILSGNVEVVKVCRSHMPSYSITNRDYNDNYIEHAVKVGNTDILDIVIKNRTPVTKIKRNIETARAYAISLGRDNIVAYLAKKYSSYQ